MKPRVQPKAQQYMAQLVNVEMSVRELIRLQIYLFDRIELTKSFLADPKITPKRYEELTVDVLNTTADLKLLTEKALKV